MNATAHTATATATGRDLLEVAEECGLLASPALSAASASGPRLWLAGENDGFSVHQEDAGHYTVSDADGVPVFGLLALGTFTAAVEGALDALHAESTADGYSVSTADRAAELRLCGVRARSVSDRVVLFLQRGAAAGDVSVAARNTEFPWLWDVAVSDSDGVDTVHSVEWADVLEIARECAF